MIIRSQDRIMILNMDCVANLYVYEIEFVDTERIAFEIRTDKCVIGIYSTEEKAIKVLDMIQNKYFEHITVENSGAIIDVLEKPKIFQMPQDSEV